MSARTGVYRAVKRVQACHELVDVQRDRGTKGFRAVLVEQDDKEVAGRNMEAAARVGLIDGGAEGQVFEAEPLRRQPRRR